MNDRVEVETFGGTSVRGAGGALSFLLTTLGLCAIAFGVLVLVFPQLLAWMVAAFFALVGIGLLIGARAARRWRQRLSVFGQGFQGPFPGP